MASGAAPAGCGPARMEFLIAELDSAGGAPLEARPRESKPAVQGSETSGSRRPLIPALRVGYGGCDQPWLLWAAFLRCWVGSAEMRLFEKGFPRIALPAPIN